MINKVDAATADAVQQVVASLESINLRAQVIRAASPVEVDDPARVAGRSVLVIDDGPTLTHGDMSYDAGYVAALAAGAREIVDPRASAAPLVASLYQRYPHLGAVLPAVGYDQEQLDALRVTVDASAAEIVVSGTPCDIAALAGIQRPVVRARYRYAPAGSPDLDEVLQRFILRTRAAGRRRARRQGLRNGDAAPRRGTAMPARRRLALGRCVGSEHVKFSVQRY